MQLTYRGQNDFVWQAEWSPDGNLIASIGFNGNRFIVWDSANGEDILIVDEGIGAIGNLTWSPDGTRILTTTGNGRATIWNAATGELLLELLDENFKSEVMEGAWTKDGRQVAVQSEDGYLRIFDAENGQLLNEFASPPMGELSMGLSWSPNGERILISGGDGIVRIFDATTGAIALSYNVGGFISADYSPDGTRVVIASTNGTIQVFPTWQSTKELIEHARDCCTPRQLTLSEREQFGLPPNE
jgi:WD40 repeat protein